MTRATNKEMLAYLAGRERVHGRDACRYQGAAGEALRRDRRAHQAGRCDRAIPEEAAIHITAATTRARNTRSTRASAGRRAAEQVMLDVNEMAKGHGFFQIGSGVVSPDSRLLAWTEDSVGRRQYVLRVKNLATGEIYPDAIEQRRERHRVGRRQQDTHSTSRRIPSRCSGDKVRKHTARARLCARCARIRAAGQGLLHARRPTKDEQYLIIESRSTVSTETQVARRSDPQLVFKVLIRASATMNTRPSISADRWILRTNWQAKNFRIVEIDAEQGGRARAMARSRRPPQRSLRRWLRCVPRISWPSREHSNGLANVRIRAVATASKTFVIASDEPAYTTRSW